jgi:2-keto-4-pentenoate hydratase
MHALRILFPLGATLALAGCATAPPDAPTCPADADVAATARLYTALQTVPVPTGVMTPEGAKCAQRKLMAALAPTHGKVVGYKAGLTNPAVQKRFNIDQPLRGTLLAGMLLNDGATVPARFGAKPFAEADLVVEVGSSAIHDATTPAQAMASLRAVIPFIELPDTLVDDPSRLTGPILVANNVGARLGVLGAPIVVTPANAAALADGLRTMTVRTTDASGKELAQGPGAAILGHPLNAVLWLAGQLKRDGITLKPGDLLSLGAFSASPVAAGQSLRVTYEGLPGTPTVGVAFR